MSVTIAGRTIGAQHPCYVVAEIGINHNGDLSLAKRLIDVAVSTGCSAVKFQKRTIDVNNGQFLSWITPNKCHRQNCL